MKILVIDDEDDIRTVARLSLANLGGMDVVTAASGAEGLLLAVNELPDVILLDVSMPELDGPATLRLIQQNPVTAHIPVVFMTAHALPPLVESLRKMGPCGVIIKPFRVADLPRQVRAFLGRS